MSSMSVVGAVGVRVRPEASGFKAETREKVLRELRGYEAEVPVVPKLKPGEAQKIKSDVARIAKQSSGTAHIGVELNAAKAKAEAEAIEKIIGDLQDKKLKIEADTSKAQKGLEELEELAKSTKDEYDRLDSQNFAKLQNAQNDLVAKQKELEASAKRIGDLEAKALEAQKRVADERSRASSDAIKELTRQESSLERARQKATEAGDALVSLSRQAEDASKSGQGVSASLAKALERAEVRYRSAADAVESANRRVASAQAEASRASGVASDAAVNAAKKAENALNSERSAYERLGAAQQEAYEKAVKQEADHNKLLQEHQNHLDSITDSVSEQRSVYNDLVSSSRQQAKEARQVQTILKGTTEELHNMLVENQREGEAFHQTLGRMKDGLEGLKNVDLSHLMDFAKADFMRDRVAHLRVEADTAMAEAQLRSLERSRVVRIATRVDSGLTRVMGLLRGGGELDRSITNITTKYGKMFSGAAGAISGFSQMQRMNKLMIEGASNMDTMALSASKLTVGIGALGGTLVSAVGWTASFGSNLMSIARGAALAPAALMTLGVAAVTSMRGLQSLGAAIKGDAEALELIPAPAREAVSSIGEIVSKADEAGKKKFFEAMSSQLQQLPGLVRPIGTMLEGAYAAQGKFFGGMLQGALDWQARGDMTPTLNNIVKALENASGAGKPFMQSMLDLATVGSRYMPQLGQALTDVTQKWANFISVSKQNGSIDRWIQEAGTQLKYLGSTIVSTMGVFGALGKAAQAAGFDGIGSLSRAMENLNQKMNSGLWQTGMTNIFKGAKQGAYEAGQGISRLGDAIMAMSAPIGQMEASIGKTMGSITTNIAHMVTNSRMLQGIGKFIDDIGIAAGRSGPMMRDMGDVFGDAATTGGELVKAAQQITAAFFRAWASMSSLTNGINAVIPVFANFATTVIDTIHVPLGALSSMLGSVLQWFSRLPGPIQTAVMAMGMFGSAAFALRNVGTIIGGLGARFPVLGNAINGAKTAMMGFSTSWGLMSQAARSSQGAFMSAGTAIAALGGNLTKAEQAGIRARVGISQIGSGVSGMTGALRGGQGALVSFGSAAKTAGTGVGNLARVGIGGLVSALGGPLGIGLMAAGAALAAFSQKSAQAKQEQSQLKATLTETGQATAESVKVISDSLSQRSGLVQRMNFDLRDSFNAQARSFGDTSAAIKATGESYTGLAQKIADGGSGYDAYIAKLDKAKEATGANGRLTREQSEAIFGTGKAAHMSGDQIAALKDKITEEHQAVEAAKASQREYAQTMGTTTQAGSQLAGAMKTIKDETSSTADKAGAFKVAMDVASGGTRSFLTTISGQSQAMGQLGQAFAQVATAQEGGAGAMVGYTNALGNASFRLDTTKSSLAQLESALMSSYDATTQQSQAIYDNAIAQGKSIGEAADLAGASQEKWRASAQQQLEAMGVDAEQARKYLQDIAGEPWVAEITFMGKTEEFMKAKQLVQQNGDDFDGRAFTAFLKANPGATQETIQNLIDKGIHWSSDTYSATLSADKGQAEGQINEIVTRGNEFNDADYQAYLKGDNSSFLDSYISAKSKGEDINSSNWKAKLGLNDGQAQQMLAKNKQDLTEIGSHDWIARMDLENPGFAEKLFAAQYGLEGISKEDWPVEVRDNFNDVMSKEKELSSGLGSLDGKTAEVSVKSNAAAQAIILEAYSMKAEGMDNEEIRQKLGLSTEEWDQVTDGLPGKWDSKKKPVEDNKAKIDADATPAENTISSFVGRIGDWLNSDEGGVFKIGLGIKDENFNEGLSRAVQKAKDWTAEKWDALIGGNDSPFNGAIGAAKGVGAIFSGTWFSSFLNGDSNPFSGAIGLAQGLGGLFSGTWFSSFLNGDSNPFSGAVGLARGIGGMFSGTWFSSFLNGNNGPMSIATAAARGIGGLFNGSWFSSLLGGNTNPMAGATSVARGIGQGFAGSRFLSWLTGDNGPFSGATQGAWNIGRGFAGSRFLSWLTGDNGPFSGATQGAWGIGRGFAGSRFLAWLTGDSGPFSGATGAARAIGQGFAGSRFSATLAATWDQVAGAVSSALSAARQWAGKVFTATMKAVKGNMDGGYYPGHKMANGGILKALKTMSKSSSVQAFAHGGIRQSELHKAMIARPHADYRVWAEPETGGEAYIPLADSKRGRSTEILGQVAERFGLTVQQYANGGTTFVGGTKPQGLSSDSSSGINYNRLGRTLADALQGTGVRVINTGDMTPAGRRR